MATTTQLDKENPDFSPPSSSSSSWLPHFEPSFPTTMFSLFANLTLTNMFVYGVTGKASLGFKSGLMTIPISLFLSLKAASEDFDRWKKMRHVREKGLPVKLMPLPYKFDWEEHENYLNQKDLEKKLKNAQNLSGTAQN